MKWKHVCFVLILSLLNMSCTTSDSVKLQLKWFHQAQFAGFYYGLESGVYEKSNISIEIIEGGPSVSHVDALVNEQVDFAVVSAEEFIKLTSSSNDVVPLLILGQKSPWAIIFRKSSNINSLEDLAGKKITFPDDAGKDFYKILLRSQESKCPKFDDQNYEYNFNSFLSGDIDAVVGHLNGGWVRLPDAELHYNIFTANDFGLPLFGDVLVARSQFVENNPHLVKSFREATVESWLTAFADFNKTVEITMKYAKEKSVPIQTEMLRQTINLAIEPGTKFGNVDPIKIAEMSEIQKHLNSCDMR